MLYCFRSGGYGGSGGSGGDDCGAVGGELVIEEAPDDPPHKRPRHTNVSTYNNLTLYAAHNRISFVGIEWHRSRKCWNIRVTSDRRTNTA